MQATQTKCQAEIEVTKKTRIGIVSCILRGELTEAIARLSTDFPNLLESNHELVFQLKFQQLVEIIGGTGFSRHLSYDISLIDSEMKNYKDTENSFGRIPGDALRDFIEKGRSLREFVLANIDNQEASKMNQIKKVAF